MIGVELAHSIQAKTISLVDSLLTGHIGTALRGNELNPPFEIQHAMVVFGSVGSSSRFGMEGDSHVDETC